MRIDQAAFDVIMIRLPLDAHQSSFFLRNKDYRRMTKYEYTLTTIYAVIELILSDVRSLVERHYCANKLLLRKRDSLFTYRIDEVLVDVRRFHATNGKLLEITMTGFHGWWTVTLLFLQSGTELRTIMSPSGMEMPYVILAINDVCICWIMIMIGFGQSETLCLHVKQKYAFRSAITTSAWRYGNSKAVRIGWSYAAPTLPFIWIQDGTFALDTVPKSVSGEG